MAADWLVGSVLLKVDSAALLKTVSKLVQLSGWVRSYLRFLKLLSRWTLAKPRAQMLLWAGFLVPLVIVTLLLLRQLHRRYSLDS